MAETVLGISWSQQAVRLPTSSATLTLSWPDLSQDAPQALNRPERLLSADREKRSLKESLLLAYGPDHGPTTVATSLPEYLNLRLLACLLSYVDWRLRLVATYHQLLD
jgi:hypothetical protein